MILIIASRMDDADMPMNIVDAVVDTVVAVDDELKRYIAMKLRLRLWLMLLLLNETMLGEVHYNYREIGSVVVVKLMISIIIIIMMAMVVTVADNTVSFLLKVCVRDYNWIVPVDMRICILLQVLLILVQV